MAKPRPSTLQNLEKRLKKLSAHEQQSKIERQAKVSVGPSTWRALAPKTKDDIRPALQRVDLRKLAQCRDEREFGLYFRLELTRIDKALSKENPKLKGRKWGYGSKILCLFLRGVVLHTRYFSDEEVLRLKKLLYVPVDRIVLDELCQLGLDVGCYAIKDLTQASFNQIQNWVADASKATNVPGVIFDNIWSDLAI